MQKIWALAISICLFSGMAWADSKFCERHLITQPFFYKASNNGHDLYILGTMHEGVSMNDLPPYVLKTLGSSTALVVEVKKPGFIGQTLLAISVGKLAFRWAGPKLSEQISPEAMELLKEEYIRNGNSPNRLDLLSPTGALLMSMRRHQGRLDDELKKKAASDGIAIKALESTRFQASLIETSFKVSAKKLEEVMFAQKLSRETNSDAPTLLAVYLQGDEAAFWSRMQSSMTEYGFSTAQTLDARNEAWISKLLSMKKNGQVFVAVGAAHLFGKNGLLSLLAMKGYKVERGPFDPASQ